VQGSATWTPPTGTLGQIVHETQVRVAELHLRRDELERRATHGLEAPSLADALRRGHAVGVIAEVKRRSPSKGWIRAGISATDQGMAYERGGASAISVLTEPLHFSGSSDDLIAVRSSVGIPVIKKDFHIDPIQLIEARACGAAAALLIVRALSPAQLTTMVRVAESLGLEIVVAVRDEDELARALDEGATIIGVNNRNLETLEITRTTGESLLPKIPVHVVAISESGVSSAEDVRAAALWGADAVLVGSSVSQAADPEVAVRALGNISRRRRDA